MANLLVTGGAGFIGGNFVHYWAEQHPDDTVIVLDCLTYAGNRSTIAGVEQAELIAEDIRNTDLVEKLLRERDIATIIHFAAESHVDRSISGPDAFIDTNILGTNSLLKAARAVWLDGGTGRDHRFHHISTDEVYGSLGPQDPAFSETTSYQPNSPYSASKASSDHLVRAYHHTFGLEVTTSNCSNNYGPYQYPEKLIPLFLLNALHGRNLPIYGDGMNVRDWLHVDDHCRGIEACLAKGRPGETYNVGGGEELPNMAVIDRICTEVDRAFAEMDGLATRFPDAPAARGKATETLKTFVTDRKGHDRRYAIDETKARNELGYSPTHAFESGLAKTLRWYLEREDWWRPLQQAEKIRKPTCRKAPVSRPRRTMTEPPPPPPQEPHRASGLATVSGVSRAVLRVAAHCDALRMFPPDYLRAVWWLLCGKKLRARLTLAPLLGQSRWAYPLWLTQVADAPETTGAASQDKSGLLALVKSGVGEERTLASLAAVGIPARLVATHPDTASTGIGESPAAKWILPLANGDTLSPAAGALYAAAIAAAGDKTHVIYADDDLIDETSRRHTPHFKPDWNSELYRHFDYISGSALLRVRDSDFADLSQRDWDCALTARVVERSEQEGGEILHLRRILHHRRTRPAPQLALNTIARAADTAALPSVSIIVPTRNGLSLLRNCLEGLARTDYPAAVEILVIDNGSDDPATLDFLANLDPEFATVLRDDGPFNFAALNNRAVEHTSGELLCFLNNDIEITEPGWLTAMAHQALRHDVGAVGARLLYPDGRIQHAGVVLGIGGGAAHAHRLLDPDEPGYFHRHALPQFACAVTAACMLVERAKFMDVGGFDAQRFAVSFNDVDLCLRLNAKGWQSLYEPRATLIHHESVSRGTDRDAAGAARLAGELAHLQDLWGTALPDGANGPDEQALDPYHHPALSRHSEAFVVRL